MIKKLKTIIIKLLKKSQKFTGTDNIYVAKYGSYLMMGNITSMAAAFLLSIAFARLLPQETYGQYRYILSIMAILAISSLQGMNMAITQAVTRGLEGVLEKGFKTKLKWSLLGSIASISIAVYFWLQGNVEFTISFLIIAVFLPFFKSGEIYQSYLDGKKLFGKRVTYTTLIQILSTVAIVAALFLTKKLIALILIYFLSYSVLRIFFLLWIIKKTMPNQNDDSQTITYGKHLSLMGIIGLIAQQVDSVLLFHFMGPIQLAIYSFAVLPIDHLRDPLQAIQELALPRLATRSVEEIKKTLLPKLIKSTVFILIGIIAYIIIAPYFFKIFYPQYVNSVFYSRLFSLTLLVFPMSMMRLALLAQKMTKQLYKINIMLPIIRIALLVVLIPLYGLLGAIVALLVYHIFHFLIVYFFFKRM